MRLSNQFRALARYNHWFNERLYATCAQMSDVDRRADRGAFFRSVHGTLNHLLLADRLWLSRFLDREFRFGALDEELWPDFDLLRGERLVTDAEIESWTAGLDDDALAAPFTFRSVVQNRDHTYPFAHLVMHFFNHQTHHRGQLTTLLSQAGLDPGVTDLLWLPGAEIEPGV